MPKKRLDQLIVDRGLAESRTRAQALVMAGLVFSGERKLDKPGTALPEDASIEECGQSPNRVPIASAVTSCRSFA